LNAAGKANFDSANAVLLERLLVVKDMHGSFLQELAESATTLSAPLLDENIETITSRGNERMTEIVKIGKRVATFKKFVEMEDAKLKEYWKHWDELQNDYIELGIEVFGPEAFGDNTPGLKIKQKGFKTEMGLLDLEHTTRVGELDGEIGEIRPGILQKMKASEKVWDLSISCECMLTRSQELDSAAKKEQARLLRALIQD
jgi:hypothetical protein